jgi:hypothetical protein
VYDRQKDKPEKNGDVQENKSKSESLTESLSQASNYARGLFNPEIKVFNDCCSLLVWDMRSAEGEQLLHDILSFMMGNTKFDFNTPIPILEKYVKLCYKYYIPLSIKNNAS